jgi:hypothetical protein
VPKEDVVKSYDSILELRQANSGRNELPNPRQSKPESAETIRGQGGTDGIFMPYAQSLITAG